MSAYDVTGDGFTFSVYNSDYGFGDHGPIRYIGDVRYKAKVPQRWQINIAFTLRFDTRDAVAEEVYNITTKCKLSELDDVIQEHFNDTLSKYTEDYYKSLGIPMPDVRPVIPFKNGSVTVWVITPRRKK